MYHVRAMNLIPAGYMAKRVKKRPESVKAPAVTDIYSLSGCISPDFAEYIHFWKHNGYWLFDSPEVIRELSTRHAINLGDARFFYYEVHDREFHQGGRQWRPFKPEFDFGVHVEEPAARQLEGFDVVTFSAGTNPECSPLSCNALADEVPVNPHCLLSSFEEAKRLLESGAFDKSEPGPFRVFAVYSI
jgi:hypothetical protein